MPNTNVKESVIWIENILDACCFGLICGLASCVWLYVADQFHWWPF